MNIHLATEHDLQEILAIQELCYHQIDPEPPQAIISKIRISPDTCFVAKDNDQIKGYLLSIPIILRNPPLLNSETTSLDKNPNSLYLHDLAIRPTARGMGVGKLLFQQFCKVACQKKFKHASLISIQNSVSFWQNYGFTTIDPDINLQKKLKTYGDNATYMECSLSNQ